MKNVSRHQDAEAEIERLLEAYGADSARWPEAARVRVAPLLAESVLAERVGVRARIAEARALDRLLDSASRPAPAPAREAALADRILAAALSEREQAAPESGTQSVAEAPAAGGTVLPWRPKARGPAPAPARTRWRAAGLMAASLAAGLVIGASANLAPVAQEIADAIGIAADLEPINVVMSDDGTAIDEDVL